MATYYFEFGTINSEKIFFQENNKEIQLLNVADIKVDRCWNWAIIFFSIIFFSTFILLNFFFLSSFSLEFFFFFSFIFLYILLKYKFLFYVSIINIENEKIIIPTPFFSKKKATRLSKRIINKINYYKGRNKNHLFYFE